MDSKSVMADAKKAAIFSVISGWCLSGVVASHFLFGFPVGAVTLLAIFCGVAEIVFLILALAFGAIAIASDLSIEIQALKEGKK